MGDDLPPEEEVVSLPKENKIGKYRTYKQEPTVLKAFANSGIELMVGVANFNLMNMSSNKSAAMEWVNEYIKPCYPTANINALPTTDNYVPYLLPAMKNIQEALVNASLDNKIKVSTAVSMDVIGISLSPSKVTFITTVKDQMTSLLKFLDQNDSPFLANVHPYKSYLESSSVGLDFTLFKSSTSVVRDGDLIYKNLFDAIVDSVYSTMGAMGFHSIPIVIAKTGWPSAGNGVATTIENSQTYMNNLIRHVLSKEGTPKTPVRSIETFIYSVFNENCKINGQEADKNWGLFYPNKTVVYHVLFSPSFSKIVTLLFYIEMDE